MRLPQTRQRGRGGFTLIEMIVVIAIIAILVALTAASALKFLRKGPEIQNRNDTSQLTTAIGAFKTKFGFYPPSQIKLCFLTSQYGNQQLDIDSQAVLTQMFPRCSTTWANNGIMWVPNLNQTGPVTLEGEECLVFFLGGWEQTSGATHLCVGFSTNPTSPMDTSDMNHRIGPFYQFEGSRLAVSPVQGHQANPILVYNDPYGTPYAYFSSFRTRNGFNRYPTGDCLTLGVSPYQDTQSTFYNPETIQIISAGANKKFGAGGPNPVWTPATAAQVNAGNGIDDMTNFYDSLMGVTP
jgi:prepilin-type N-terminal cleavage/methylation domain-containing protein